MKKKLEWAIEGLRNMCYTLGKYNAAKFVESTFMNILNKEWEDSKPDAENLAHIKDVFEFNKKLNELTGNKDIVKLISAFQVGWLDKLKV